MSPTSQPKPTTTITKSNSSAPKPTGVQKHQSKKQKPHSILRYEDALKALYYKANDQQVWKNAAYQQGYQPTVYQHGYQQVYQQQVYLATSYQQGYPQQQVYQPPTQQVWSTPTYQQVHQPFTHHPLHTDAGFSAGLPPGTTEPFPALTPLPSETDQVVDDPPHCMLHCGHVICGHLRRHWRANERFIGARRIEVVCGGEWKCRLRDRGGGRLWRVG